jgi:ABC-type bacteriocin/lantibiotic exporter with double-glycine peptidase domain
MLLRYHDVRMNEVEMSALCRLDPADGIDPEVLLEGAERFGLRAEAQTAAIEELQTLTAQQIYPIALIVPQREDPLTTMHTVVVRRVYRRKIRLYDPLIGKVNVPIADFEHRWAARGRWLIIVRG